MSYNHSGASTHICLLLREHSIRAAVSTQCIVFANGVTGRVDAAFRTSMSVSGHHINWVLGVDTVEEALKKLEDFRLDGVVQGMRSAFLLLHGAEDEQVPAADAEALFKAVGSKDKTLRVFTAEEGGSQHCQRDYLSMATTTIFDWLQEKL